ncbi:Cytochrome P450 oxidoreductase [Penicillium concentricum]|uniref:Cytochrome P450 oxidoreductase n=1 Tax=Penicillium concentricum TaxID=293559 RepID=A0A9W9S965_9EURO|nr:Cytochrome P450 oxidoreductase [Penicillium concentricum]KAJ5373922.1 Cytochrome P450 oxidoreductase [Penicillium concentricum]
MLASKETLSLLVGFAKQYWPIVIFGVLISWALSQKYLTPLRHIPGPFFASWTRLPRFFAVLRGRPHEWELDLHRKYGKVVRTGPDLVSVGDPAEINVIYNASDKFKKSAFYIPFMIYDDQGLLPDPLVLSDKTLHTRMKKNAYNAYSMGSMLQLEPLVDTVTNRLFKILDEIVETPSRTCDLGKWLRYYATDVIFTVTFGEDLQFMEKGDPIGMMPMLEYVAGDYTAIVGQFPWVHKFLLGNSFISSIVLGSSALDGAVLNLALKQVVKFRQKMSAQLVTGPSSFVQRLLEHQVAHPDSITDRELNTHAFGNVTAGADTTAIAMRTIMFNVIKHPEIYDTLCREIREEARLTIPITYGAASTLPYLDAVIKEALRIHPPNGVMFGRTVPPEGATICGKFMPGGTEVGISPWVVHYDPELFPEPEKFQPERWLSKDADLVAQRKRSIFAFSAGSHTCLGKNISLVEITKLVASLLVQYDLELVDPNAKLSFKCRWFTPQTGLMVKLAKRHI